MLIISFLFQVYKSFFPPYFDLYLGRDRILFHPMDDSFQCV